MIRNLKFGNTIVTCEIKSESKEKWYPLMYDIRKKTFSKCNCKDSLCRRNEKCKHIQKFAEVIGKKIIIKPKERIIHKRKPQYYTSLISMCGECEICKIKWNGKKHGEGSNLTVHHITRIIDGGKEVPRNCQIVCRNGYGCKFHDYVHAHQGRRG